MTEVLKCLICGTGELVGTESTRSVDVDGGTLTIPYRMHACTTCGAVQGTEGDLRFNARAMRKATKERHNLLTGEEVREIRQRLCLTQEQAAKLFGGGPVAFSKYENDEVSQSESMDRLIWLAGQFPWLIGALATRVSLDLSHQACLVVEKFHMVFAEEYIAHAKALARNTRVAFEGFSALPHASNDEQIYRPNLDPKTRIREAA